MEPKKRVIMARIGLDSHDIGSRFISKKLSEDGFEVIYFPFYEPHELVNACIQENAEVVGISSMTGSHLYIVRGIMEAMKKNELGDIPVVVGGIIPIQDHQELKDMGVREVFSTGSDIDKIIRYFNEEI